MIGLFVKIIVEVATLSVVRWININERVVSSRYFRDMAQKSLCVKLVKVNPASILENAANSSHKLISIETSANPVLR